MSEKVWLISSGTYSDYLVACVCPTKKDAQALVKKMNGSTYAEYCVEERDLVTADMEEVQVLSMSITIWDDGRTEQWGVEEGAIKSVWPFETDAPAVAWRWVRAPVHNNQGGRLDVHGTDFERVRRVFSDRKAMILAGDPLHLKREAQGRVP